MDASEYANLERIETNHWYYSGKRQLVREWIMRVQPPASNDVLLDCGAGTGRFAKEMERFCRVFVLDDHEESLRLLRTRFDTAQILQLDAGRVPLPDGSTQYVTALDVLEHVPGDATVVKEFHRLLAKGGLVVVTVPAGKALWSDWDVALHHYRRYSRTQLKAVFPNEDWDIVYLNYTNVVLYPVVWIVRKWRRWFPELHDAVRSEDRVPVSWINTLLRTLFVGLAKSRASFPFGVSLLLVARKR